MERKEKQLANLEYVCICVRTLCKSSVVSCLGERSPGYGQGAYILEQKKKIDEIFSSFIILKLK